MRKKRLRESTPKLQRLQFNQKEVLPFATNTASDLVLLTLRELGEKDLNGAPKEQSHAYDKNEINVLSLLKDVDRSALG